MRQSAGQRSMFSPKSQEPFPQKQSTGQDRARSSGAHRPSPQVGLAQSREQVCGLSVASQIPLPQVSAAREPQPETSTSPRTKASPTPCRLFMCLHDVAKTDTVQDVTHMLFRPSRVSVRVAVVERHHSNPRSTMEIFLSG
jgi:hypothetical protein